MSKSTLVGKRYASALFTIAKEKDLVGQFEKDLKLVAKSIEDNPAFVEILSHPGVDVVEKITMINAVFAKAIDSHVLHTLQILCERRRSYIIGNLAQYFSVIASRELGQVDAIVTSAVVLDSTALKEIQEKFTTLLGKQVRLQSVVNSALIGGIQVRVGDTLYDGSISGKLNRLSKQLQQSQAL